MALISKLQDGRVVNDPPSRLKCEKKWFHAVVIALVSKLSAGTLVKAPLLLKALKKLFPTLATSSPNKDIPGIALTNTSLAVVQVCGTRGPP